MRDLLKTYFGYDKFRPLQEEVMSSVLQGRDTFVLMPTGGGKSLCYQLPALKFPGLTLVISPLIALMKDQVDALRTNGITAAFINSSLSFSEINQIQRDVQAGQVKILYVAPERLAVGAFQQFLQNLELSLIAIDEAHCISEWGHDFRPDYRNLKMLRQLFPQVSVAALTATATPKVREDILRQLALRDAQIFVSSFDRPNLSLQVLPKRRAFDKLYQLLKKYDKQSAIVYCFSRKNTEELAEDLKASGIKALPYHAGLENEVRKKTQDLFIKDEISVVVATIAFGMGIDKPDIRLVVHYTFPKTLEGYYQEIGRAGRDGLPSECVLFYSLADRHKHQFFINQIEDENEREKTRVKLDRVVDYCELDTCRRRYLLHYFGEKSLEEKCSGCDICQHPQDKVEATEIAQKILSTVVRTGNRFGQNHIVDILSGSRKQAILRYGHEQLPVFGIGHDYSIDELRHFTRSLTNKGFLQKAEGRYPTLSVSPRGIQFLKSGEKLELPQLRQEFISEQKSQLDLEYDQQLFEELRALRKQLADQKGVPPFVIFGDKSLHEMAYYFPIAEEDFLRIEGVGAQKLANFGQAFLDVIKKYIQENKITPKEIPDRQSRQRVQQERQVRLGGDRYERTQKMVQQKMPLDKIAEEQGFKEGTIVAHIERLLTSGKKLDLNYLKPEQSRFEVIRDAFQKCGDDKLRPVFELLQEKYSYDEIRLVRLFLMLERY